MNKIIAKKRYTMDNLIGFFLIAGLILPASVAANTINKPLRYGCFLLLYLLCIIIIQREQQLLKSRVKYSVIILGLLLFFTIYSVNTNHVFEYSLGNMILYCAFLFGCNTPIHKLKANKMWDKMFLAIMVIVLIFVFGTILDIGFFDSILTTYYVEHAYFFVSGMIRQNKPVSFFTSHSIAAFMYCFFCVVIYIRHIEYKKSIVNILLLVGFVVAIVFLDSNSSRLVLIVLGLLYCMSKWNDFSMIMKVLAGITVALLVIYFVTSINLQEVFLPLLGTERNGLISRYTLQGALSSSIRYIMSGAMPTGLTDITVNGDDLYYRDSVWLVNYLRGGILLVVCYLRLLYIFLKQSIHKKKYIFVFFMLTCCFDVGFTLSMEHRFWSYLLFVIPYLNYLTERTDELNRSN